MKLNKRSSIKIVVMFGILLGALIIVMPKEKTTVDDEMIVDVVEESTIILKVDEVQTVRLVANPTTGYDWSCLNLPACCMVDISYEPSTSNALGAPGEAVVTITGVAIGSGSLALGYQRSWEDVPAIETKNYFITVTE